ncbi:MAG: queuosine precursor transporter [Planctomycetes bacterium]|nr:queuosine precursor transporter [Planctomycetota bacterium]
MLDEPRPGERTFLLLVALFVAALVTCNLIANKFVTVDLGFLGFSKPFVLSAGVLPYPVTFLVTDVLSEVYGKRRANQVVFVGFAASLFVLAMLALGAAFPAIEDSKVDDETYLHVFQNAWRIIAASMTAYLVAQLVDIRIFHFWKRKTAGRHLWLRNNASTMLSQFVDTVLVIHVLFLWDVDYGTMWSWIVDGWTFKLMMAALDTPFCYLAIAWLRRIGLEPAPVDE